MHKIFINLFEPDMEIFASIEEKYIYIIKDISSIEIENCCKKAFKEVTKEHTIINTTSSIKELKISFVYIDFINLKEYYLGLYKLDKKRFYENIYDKVIKALNLKKAEYKVKY